MGIREVLTIPELARKRGIKLDDYAAFVAELQFQAGLGLVTMTRIESGGWSLPAVVVERRLGSVRK